MKKLLSLSFMLSLGLASFSPALNAAQTPAMQSNPSGWQAAKKWFRSGRKMSALTPQEKKAFNNLKKKMGIGAIVTGVMALLGGGAAATAAARRRRNANIPQVAVDVPLPTAPRGESITPGDWIELSKNNSDGELGIVAFWHVKGGRGSLRIDTYNAQHDLVHKDVPTSYDRIIKSLMNIYNSYLIYENKPF